MEAPYQGEVVALGPERTMSRGECFHRQESTSRRSRMWPSCPPARIKRETGSPAPTASTCGPCMYALGLEELWAGYPHRVTHEAARHLFWSLGAVPRSHSRTPSPAVCGEGEEGGPQQAWNL